MACEMLFENIIFSDELSVTIDLYNTGSRMPSDIIKVYENSQFRVCTSW